MKTINKNVVKSTVALGKQRSYQEVVEFLDAHWKSNLEDKNLTCVKQLDKAFENISQKVSSIAITGTNGKSLTMQFTVQLLKEEGLKVGALYAPHILTYNERFSLNGEQISNKSFTDMANEVIAMVESLDLKPNTSEILLIMSLLYFSRSSADVVLLEVDETMLATSICNSKIAAITRVTDDGAEKSPELLEKAITESLRIVKKGAYVVSADQSKLNLKAMAELVEQKGAIWSMPIRKLIPLAYPYEQLHGRCAALAERIAHIYVNTFANKESIVLSETLLTKQKGQRGRPTLEAKRQSELNPKRTIEQFWKEISNTLPGRFQVLEKEKPTILLDNASNLDAFENLLLGIRLLHYQRPLKGLALIIGCNNQNLDVSEFLRLLRYFFKKTSGQVTICPVAPMPWDNAQQVSWDVEKITNEIKSMKIKAKCAGSFKEAFEAAQKSVDERHGLVVIAGSASLVAEYWNTKGIKKI